MGGMFGLVVEMEECMVGDVVIRRDGEESVGRIVVVIMVDGER